MIKKFLIFLISSTVLLTLVDVFLQISEIQSTHFSMIDPIRGKVNIPGKKVMFISEGFYLGGTNNQGYWGPEYLPEKGNNTYRIALVGNSFVEGIQLFDKYHFRSIIEENLKDELGIEVEVLNFGKGRNSISDMLYSYNYNIKAYNPDLTLFFIDYSNVYLSSEKQMEDLAPIYYLEGDELKVDYSFQQKNSYKIIQKVQFFLKNSSLTRLLYNCYKMVSVGETPQILFGKFYKSQIDESNSVKKQPKFTSLNPLSKKLFSEIIKTESNLIVFNPRDSVQLPPELGELLPEDQLIDLNTPLDSVIRIGINPNYWEVSKTTGHWNHVGHKVVGEYLSKQLSQSIQN